MYPDKTPYLVNIPSDREVNQMLNWLLYVMEKAGPQDGNMSSSLYHSALDYNNCSSI